MKSLWKLSLLASATFSLGLSAAMADESAPEAVEDVRALETVVVVGQAQTYSSAETTETMALTQSPVTSLLAQVDQLPGVLIQEGDTFGFDDWSTSIAVRGFQTSLGAQQLGITVDGMPNGNSNYGGGSKANRYIDSQNAGAIEVSQGTADIASRSNEALGGTINFTTQDPEDERRVRVSATLGSFDAQRFYGRYDTGRILGGTTTAWISLSTQSATDHVEGSAENRRDHVAAKVKSEAFGIDWTAYASFDDAHEDNYDQLYSPADFAADPDSDRLIGNWTGTPYVDQSYRRAWSTLRENFFAYVKGEKEVFDGLTVEAGLYRHDMDGRGDWIPPYLVNVTADGAGQPESEFLGGNTVNGGPFLGQIFFVDPTGVALAPEAGCVSSLTFPYGGTSNAAYDPACYPRNSIPAMSYRHTHYQKNRTGLTLDGQWDAEFTGVSNMLRGGIWYENTNRYEYRDWHKVIDARVGMDYDYQAYWVQYNREFPQTTFKWYVEDVVSFGDFTVRLGAKQFFNDIERVNLFNTASTIENFTIETESDVLLSGGASWSPAAMDGLEVFVGYAENYKALTDGLLEALGRDNNGNGTLEDSELFAIPNPETSDNIEVGVRYAGERFRGSAVYFDTSFENRLIFISNGSVGGIDYLEATNGGYINAGGIESSGFELTGEFLVSDRLSVYAAYTYNDSTILGTGNTVLDATVGILPGKTVPGIAENMLVLSTDWTDGNFYAGASTKYVGDRYVNTANTWVAESYVDTDLYVGVSGEAISDTLKDVDFRLTVNNLFDVDYLSGISGNAAWISAPRTVAFTVTADF